MFPLSFVATVVAVIVLLIRLWLRKRGVTPPGVVWVILAGAVSAIIGSLNDLTGAGVTRETVNNVLAVWVTAAGGWATLKAVFEHALNPSTTPEPMLPDPMNLPAPPAPAQVLRQAKDTAMQVLSQPLNEVAAAAAPLVHAPNEGR